MTGEELRQHIFFPCATEQIEEAKKQGGRFVYYTSAATAFQILTHQEIWMRNTRVMNDFAEIDHGVSCLVRVLRSEAGEALDVALNTCFPGIAEEIRALFQAWFPGIRQGTFVTCVSEHVSSEDQHGRLSMWRAYGGAQGVALVLNGNVMFNGPEVFSIYASPVAYLEEAGVRHYVQCMTERIAANSEYVKSLGCDGLKGVMFNVLRFGAVCTKHPAFAEEKEWRLVAAPCIQKSELLPMEHEVVGGVPQPVLKIKLQDKEESGVTGVSIAALVDRVLIGPCEHPEVIQQTLWQLLANAGVQDAENKIVQTHIPLRSNQR